MPVIVPVAYGVGILAFPLATLIPLPAAIARRVNGVSLLLLWAGITLLALAAAQHQQDHPYTGLLFGSLGLASFWLMLWVADVRKRHRTDEDDDSSEGGGGGPGTPRQPPLPDAPGGTGLDWDWDDFDRQRERWTADDRPLTPV